MIDLVYLASNLIYVIGGLAAVFVVGYLLGYAHAMEDRGKK